MILSVSSAFGASRPDSITAPKILSQWSADGRCGYVFSSKGFTGYEDAAVKDNLHTAASGHLRYSFAYGPSTRQGLLYPGAYQGIGLAVTSFFDHRAIGTPVSLYLFQGAPIKRFSRRLSLGYEWNFGASFGWRKYNDDEGMRSNLLVGSSTNAVINLGLLLDYKLTDEFTLRGGFDATHYSNGNTSIPNPGVNSLGLRLGVVYTPRGRMDMKYETPTDDDLRSYRRRITYDLLVWGAAHKQLVDLSDEQRVASPGRFATAGISFAPMYEVCRFFRAGVSVDFKYDEASNLQKYLVDGSYEDNIRFYRQPLRECMMAGLSARAELVMPVFSVNVGLGQNIIGVRANRHFYQTLNLKAHITQRLWLNCGYQLHSFHHPDNLILGLGYTFH